MVQDGGASSKWGVLQYYQRVDEKLSEAEIKAQAAQLLQQKARQTRTLVVQGVGHPDCRAGVSLMLELSEVCSPCTITSARHQWSGDAYTMRLTLEVLS